MDLRGQCPVLSRAVMGRDLVRPGDLQAGTVRTAGKAPLPQRPPRPTPRSETGAQVGSGERVVSRENMFKVLL